MSITKEEFKDRIEALLQIKGFIKQNNFQLKQLRQRKTIYEEDIIDFMKKNNINNLKINKGKFELKVETKMQKARITKSIVKDRLLSFSNGDEQKAKYFESFLYDNSACAEVEKEQLHQKKTKLKK